MKVTKKDALGSVLFLFDRLGEIAYIYSAKIRTNISFLFPRQLEFIRFQYQINFSEIGPNNHILQIADLSGLIAKNLTALLEQEEE